MTTETESIIDAANEKQLEGMTLPVWARLTQKSGVLDTTLSTALDFFSKAVLEAESDEETLRAKIRYQAVIDFGQIVLNAIDEMAKLDRPSNEPKQIHFDS